VATLLLPALLALQETGDLLLEAVRDTRLEAAEAALGRLARTDGARAARILSVALGRARDRLPALIAASMGARSRHEEVETRFAFELDEEAKRKRATKEAEERVRETSRRAIDGELIHDAIRAAFARLGEGADAALAAEAGRTSSWLQKCELYAALGAREAREPLLAALEREKEPVVVATILSGLEGAEALRGLDHANWQVRLAAVRALRSSRDAVGPLVASLPGADARYRNAAVESLVAVTGTVLPVDPAVWADWWKANRADFLARTYRPGQPRVLEGPGRTTFYGVPIDSTRVCFVIDRSRSMREGERFEAAKRELRRLLGELPDGARVNILFFGATVSAFARAPRALDAAARQDAAGFISRQLYEGFTDLHLAVQRALVMVGNPETGLLHEDGVDTIVVLSDGMATAGKIVDDELLGRTMARRARFLRPVIHTVSLSSDAVSLRWLSRLNGGEHQVR
jgi:hypothetical protein